MQHGQTSYTIGDPVKVCDSEGEYYGVVVNTGAELTVQMIKQDVADKVYRITDSAFLVPAECVVDHKPLHGSDDGAPHAFYELGFRMLDGGSFVRHIDEVGDQLMPVGDAAFELVSDEDSEYGSMEDFIVDDDKCEPFTHADPSIPFVHETHQAVLAYNNWIPGNEQEHNAREFIQQQEARAVQIDDEIRFARGMAAANYSQPG